MFLASVLPLPGYDTCRIPPRISVFFIRLESFPPPLPPFESRSFCGPPPAHDLSAAEAHTTSTLRRSKSEARYIVSRFVGAVAAIAQLPVCKKRVLGTYPLAQKQSRAAGTVYMTCLSVLFSIPHIQQALKRHSPLVHGHTPTGCCIWEIVTSLSGAGTH